MNQSAQTGSDMNSFILGLAGLPESELKKAKTLFIKNAIINYEAKKREFDSQLLLPVLGWASYVLNKPAMNATLNGMKNQILAAIEVWGDDLQGQTFEVDGERIEL